VETSSPSESAAGGVAEGPPPRNGAVDHAVRLAGAAGAQIVAIPWIGVLIGILLVGGIAQTTAPCGCFLTSDNILTVGQQFSYVGIAALGGAMVIMTRGIDLSVGSTMGLAGFVVARMLGQGISTVPAILIGLGVGLAAGAVNAFLITGIGMQPFIATLGMLSVVRGAATAWSQGFTVYPPTSFTQYGQGKLLSIPNPVIVMLGLAALLTVFLLYTPLGRHIYAVGGNEDASRLLGIKTKRVKAFVYTIAGVLAAAGGILLMSFLGSADPGAATGYELDVIAAAVIGGVSLFGGEGTLVGVILGAALIEEIRNALVLDQVPGYWTQLVIGLVILTAMAIDQARRRLRRL
jgi:ribose transport system permease protein